MRILSASVIGMEMGWKGEDAYPKYPNLFSCESNPLLSLCRPVGTQHVTAGQQHHGHASIRATVSFSLYGRFPDHFLFSFLVTFLSFCDKNFSKNFSRGKNWRTEKNLTRKIWKKNFQETNLKKIHEKTFSFKTKSLDKNFLHPKRKKNSGKKFLHPKQRENHMKKNWKRKFPTYLDGAPPRRSPVGTKHPAAALPCGQGARHRTARCAPGVGSGERKRRREAKRHGRSSFSREIRF